MPINDNHSHSHSPELDDQILAPPGSPTHTGGFLSRPIRRCISGNDASEGRFFRSYRAVAALVDRVADFDLLLTALEGRPAAEGPLEACRALTDSPVAQELTLGPDDVQAIQLLSDHPSLGGYFFWKMQAATGRMAVEFGRRMGVPHTDLRPQLLASAVMASLNAALVAWLSEEGASFNALIRRALQHMGEGLDWPAGGSTGGSGGTAGESGGSTGGSTGGR
jgi:hypothetical protein